MFKRKALVTLIDCILSLTISSFLLFYRQGYQDDYNRAKRTAYNDYYADYKHYDYAGMSQ